MYQARAGRCAVRWLGLLAAMAYAFSPGQALAQEVEFESPAAAVLEVTSASEEANSHFWMAMSEWENIFFTRAAQHLERALSLDPTFGMARVVHGFIAPGLPQTERQAQITEGLGMLGDASSAELAMATSLKEWSGGNTTAARSLMSAVAELVPGDRHVAYLNALLTLNVNQREGLQALQAVAKRFPDYGPVQNILAYNLWNTGDRVGGMKAVMRYAELMPNHPNPHDSWAELLQWDGRYEEAAKHYRKAVELDDTYVAGYQGLAEVSHLMGQSQEGRSYLERAIEHAPTIQARINIRRAMANSYVMDGDHRRAMEIFTTVVADAQANDITWLATLAHQQAAATDAMLGRGQSVAKHLVAAAEIGGADTPQQHAWTAFAHTLTGDLDGARDAIGKLEKAVADAPGWQDALRGAKAMVRLHEGNPADALSELEGADPTDLITRALMAHCYHKMGQRADAQALRDDVLNDPRINLFDPATPVARHLVKKL